MKSAQQWIQQYAETHRDPTNRKIHKICVPAILVSLLGILWHVQIGGGWNAAWILVALALIFYARLGIFPFVVMAATAVAALGIVQGVEQAGNLAIYIYISIFVAAWIGQFVGHHIEGKKPSFFQDLQFLLIGPLWIFYG